MTSRSVTITTVLSMLLCAAIVQLWCAPDVRVVFLRHGTQWEAYSRGGAIGLTNAPQVELEGAKRQAAMLPHLFGLIGMAGRDEPSLESDRERERAAIRLLQAAPRSPALHYSAPYWLVTLLCFLVVLTAAATRSLRDRRRRRMGRCTSCGYDLRGSVRRCPECGTRMTIHQAGFLLRCRPCPTRSRSWITAASGGGSGL